MEDGAANQEQVFDLSGVGLVAFIPWGFRGPFFITIATSESAKVETLTKRQLLSLEDKAKAARGLKELDRAARKKCTGPGKARRAKLEPEFRL